MEQAGSNVNARTSDDTTALFMAVQNGRVEVVEYLKEIPTETELRGLIEKLGIAPEQLIRKGEKVFKEHFKGKSLSDDEWVTAMLDYPVLIERPVVVSGNKAILGRPPENVLELL